MIPGWAASVEILKHTSRITRTDKQNYGVINWVDIQLQRCSGVKVSLTMRDMNGIPTGGWQNPGLPFPMGAVFA